MQKFDYNRVDDVISELREMGLDVYKEGPTAFRKYGVNQPELCVGIMEVHDDYREAYYGEYNIATIRARNDPTLRKQLDRINEIVFG